MPKPKIPNQKKKYSAHQQRIERYMSILSQVYSSLNAETAKLVNRIGYDGESPFRFSDYPQTKASIDKIQSEFASNIQAIIINGITAEWGESNFVQDELAKKVLSTFGADWQTEKYRKYFNNNHDALESFLARKSKGLNLSQKVWNLSNEYKNGLEAAVSLGAGSGVSAIELSKRISKYLNNFPKLRKDYTAKFGKAIDILDCEYQSARLARTEINIAYRTAEQTRWSQMDFVVGYEVKRSGKSFSCKVCEALAGKYPKGFKFIGWHPNCMCYVIPILKTEDEFWAWDGSSKVGTSSINEVKDVPDGFKKWVSDNQNRISDAKQNGTLPYFLKDNQSYIKEDKEKYIQAVTKYTGSYYPRINQYLRGQRKQLDDESLSVIEDISKYISLSDKYVGTSYRGIVADRKVFDDFASTKKGDTFTEKGFMSTSANKLVAEDFADGTEYKIIFEIRGKNGVDISYVSDIEEEKEVLFDKSSKFKILKITKNDKKNYGDIHIFMEEI